MSTLTVDQISKSFGNNKALNRVSFECKEGEFVVIVGPSGAGKSTTLNCISGVEYPDEGTIYFGDKDVTMMQARDRNVAMVFETYALYPQYTVYNNLAFPLRSPRYRIPEDEINERILRVTKLLSIDMLLERLPRQLSQGQRQRVSLGRALVRTPELFLLDEPISHLDAKLRNSMRRELKLMRDSLSQTTVYVTHDYLEALSLADRVVVLYKGEVLQFDQVKNIYNRPAAIEVGNVFGDPPMMFFTGTINDQNEFVSEGDSFTLSTQGTISELKPGQQDVVLGIRPTDIKLTEPAEGQITGEVYSVQNQFDRQMVTIKSNGHLIDVIAAVKLSISEGDKASVRIDPEDCYYFDRVTNKAL